MSEVKPEYYKAAYNKLYAYLRNKHPEILREYTAKLKKAKEEAENLVILGD
jgi:hydrogenase maturation factor HypE